MTYKSVGITHKVPSEWLEVSPELAKQRGIESGALVRLTSPYGTIKVRVQVTGNVTGNQLYLTMNSRDKNSAVNRLTSSYHDRITHTPNYKEIAVKMEVLEKDGSQPLPSWNYRFGNRTPQIGVHVEEKWERADYVPISEAIDIEGEGHIGEGYHSHP